LTSIYFFNLSTRQEWLACWRGERKTELEVTS